MDEMSESDRNFIFRYRMKPTERNKAEAELFEGLSKRIYEVGIYMGLPEWYEIKYEGYPPHPTFGSHLRHFGDEIDWFINAGLMKTANHSARISLDCVGLADMLGFGRDESPPYTIQLAYFVQAAIHHDLGKTSEGLKEVSEKEKGFTEKDRNKMKEHVIKSGYHIHQVRSIIIDHHRWQKKPYTFFSPKWQWVKDRFGLSHFERTPESETLSKFLGILDYHDSAATRVNERSGNRMLSNEEVRNLLIRDYGELKIKYAGNQLPKFDMNGRQLIETLFDIGIFGRKDAWNPYAEPYSFIRRKDGAKALELRGKMMKREAIVREKLDRYNAIEHEEYLKREALEKTEN